MMTPLQTYWKVAEQYWHAPSNAWVDTAPEGAHVVEIELGRLAMAMRSAGLPYPPGSYVPERVEMWQAKAALRAAGLFDAADAAVTASNNIALHSVWIDGNTVRRNSPAIKAMASSMGLTEQEVNQLFTIANDIET